MCSWGHTTLIGQCREYYWLSINYALDSEKIASCAYTKWSSMTGINKQRISPEPKTWIGKCYIPIAQWLEYLACGWGVTGSSPNQAYTIFHFIKLDYFKFTVEIGAVAHARLSFHGLTKLKNKTMVVYSNIAFNWNVSLPHIFLVRVNMDMA